MKQDMSRKLTKKRKKRLVKYWKSDSSWLITVTVESTKGIGSPESGVTEGCELGIKSRSTGGATNALRYWFTSPAPGNYLN